MKDYMKIKITKIAYKFAKVTKAENFFWELSKEGKPSAMSMPSSPCFRKAYLTESVFTKI